MAQFTEEGTQKGSDEVSTCSSEPELPSEQVVVQEQTWPGSDIAVFLCAQIVLETFARMLIIIASVTNAFYYCLAVERLQQSKSELGARRPRAYSEPAHTVAAPCVTEVAEPCSSCADIPKDLELSKPFQFVPILAHHKSRGGRLSGSVSTRRETGTKGKGIGMALPSICEEHSMDAGSREDIVMTSERAKLSDFDIHKSQVQCRNKATGKFFGMRGLCKASYSRRPAPVASSVVQKDMLCLSCPHPNVAQLECAFNTDNYWVLVVEFCNLGFLDAHIRSVGDPGLDCEDASILGSQILQGLAHMHGCNILHRDVRPGNIAICGPADSPTAKLLDFGFIKSVTGERRRPMMGSRGYCAPETHLSAEFHDERVDLYSFGICLFVMLVGCETDEGGTIWTHSQFQAMLEDPEHQLWHCPRYQECGVFGEFVIPELRECGAFETISTLTATQARDRPSTAVAAARLPFFETPPQCDQL